MRRSPRPHIVEERSLNKVKIDGEGPDPGYAVGQRVNYRGTPMDVTEKLVVGDCWFYTFEVVR